MAAYNLPDLPYDYGALEPAMSGEILELHHSKHHAAYVKGANDTLDQLAEAAGTAGPALTVGLEKTLAFNRWSANRRFHARRGLEGREHPGLHVDAVAALAGIAPAPGGRQVPPLVFSAWDSATGNTATTVVNSSGNPARTPGPPPADVQLIRAASAMTVCRVTLRRRVYPWSCRGPRVKGAER
jgi:Iron/manganese superoxide dismutases, alpha-hairpin domain